MTTDEYVLGHADAELSRLMEQSKFFGLLTEQVLTITRTLMPVIEKTGLATAADVDLNTLEERLRGEAVERNATIVAPPLVGAWVRRPA